MDPIANTETFRCADGRFVQLNATGASGRFLRWLLDAAGEGSWAAEGLTDELRLAGDPALAQQLRVRLAALFLTRSAQEWEDLGAQAGVPLCRVRSAWEWAQTPHARTSRQVVEVRDPELGPLFTAGLAVHTAGSALRSIGPRRLPDADRAEILAALGEPRPPRGEGIAADADHEGGASPPMPVLPYDGLEVVDLTEILAGPSSGRILAEFGAHVVKVNSPRGRIYAHGVVNRGKQSVLLDVESPHGQAVFWRLVQGADVVIQNYARGTAERYGIGYEHVKARNPTAVYVSVSCYGYGGTWDARRGYETQGQAATGIMERAGGDQTPAVVGPYNILDFGTGVLASFAAAVALYERSITGRGQHVHASLTQTGTTHQAAFVPAFNGVTGDEPRGPDTLGPGPLRRLFRAADGWFFAALGSGDLERLEGASALEGRLRPPRPDDASPATRLEELFASETTSACEGALRSLGTAAHAVVPLDELMVDPFVRSQGLSVVQVSEEVGEVVMPGLCAHLSRTPPRLGAAARRPGADAGAVLAQVGMQDRAEPLERAWALRLRDLPAGW
jgi:crotonobetainyl-CoA:carnitine CoA-transferase CaiB-like acyl-CoA transferase